MADPAPKTQEQIDADAERLRTDRLAFEAEQRTARETANASIVDTLVAGGKLLPKDADRAKLIFNALDPAPLEFAAGEAKRSPAAELAALLGGAVKLVPVDDGRRSPVLKFAADKDGDPDTASGKITAAARALMKEDESLTFEAAVERVTAEQEG